tara:strand:- start:22 stop:435 length:414 start_codon:yes stop_codon:yes gene_type:complete
MSKEINQEYVNENINEIIEFLSICEPEKTIKNKRNWKYSLLKDYKTKWWQVVSYQKYNEGVNMINNYEKRIDEFYDEELALDRRAELEAPLLAKLQEHDIVWRQIVQDFKNKLQCHMSARDYHEFLDELNYDSYYGL